MALPRLVYDDDCGFCTWCAGVGERFGNVEAVGFAELSPDQKARLPEDWHESAHLLTDDAVYSGGAAIQAVVVRMTVLFAAVFLGISAGLWLSHLLTMLHTAVEQNNLSTDG